MRSWLLLFSLPFSLAFTQSACDVIPEEGTIVYDVDFLRADANVGTEGSSRDGAGNTTTTNNFGPSYQVGESDGSPSVTESGAEGTLKLVKEPTANVVRALVSAANGEVTLSTNTLTFTPSNWNIAQTVNLSAVEDGISDGDQSNTVTITFSSSNTLLYAKGLTTEISVTTVESGTIISPAPPVNGTSITITQSGGNTTITESGATDTINLVLNEATTANVTLTIALPDGEISSSPTTVTFTPSNWNAAQIVTISAVEDGVVDSNQDTSTVSVSSSSDPNYSSGVPAPAYWSV